MILYGSSLSPYVRKVLAFAGEKGIELELVPVGIGDPNPDFRAASPFGKMPAFTDGDFGISDSTAIIAYLDAIRPDPNLIPTEARARARCVWWEEFADTIVMDCGRRMFFNRVVAPMFLKRAGDLEAADQAEREMLPPLLDYLEGEVPDAGGFLIEDRITLADLAVASPLANVTRHLAIDISGHPRTKAWLDAILARPSLGAWIDRECAFFEKVREAAG